MRMPTSCPARISAASRRWRPRLTRPLRETGRSTSTARVPAACCGSGDAPAGTAPLAASLVRSAGDRWERRVLIRVPPADRWIRSQSAQNRITVPARAGPSQNCFPATWRFPDGGTTRSNSTGPPSLGALAGLGRL